MGRESEGCRVFVIIIETIKMEEKFYIQLFEDKQVRIVWDEEKEKYYFAVADIVEILTESKDVKQYIKRMRARDPELNSKWGTICTPVEMIAPDGKPRMTNASDLEGRGLSFHRRLMKDTHELSRNSFRKRKVFEAYQIVNIFLQSYPLSSRACPEYVQSYPILMRAV